MPKHAQKVSATSPISPILPMSPENRCSLSKLTGKRCSRHTCADVELCRGLLRRRSDEHAMAAAGVASLKAGAGGYQAAIEVSAGQADYNCSVAYQHFTRPTTSRCGRDVTFVVFAKNARVQPNPASNTRNELTTRIVVFRSTCLAPPVRSHRRSLAVRIPQMVSAL